jgi:hypothetical protein
MFSNDESQQWTPVIARALARIALHVADLDGKSISERAAFLQSLGLPKEEIAGMLGTSPASVAELLRLRAKKGEQNGQAQTVAAKKTRRK